MAASALAACGQKGHLVLAKPAPAVAGAVAPTGVAPSSTVAPTPPASAAAPR